MLRSYLSILLPPTNIRGYINGTLTWSQLERHSWHLDALQSDLKIIFDLNLFVSVDWERLIKTKRLCVLKKFSIMVIHCDEIFDCFISSVGINLSFFNYVQSFYISRELYYFQPMFHSYGNQSIYNANQLTIFYMNGILSRYVLKRRNTTIAGDILGAMWWVLVLVLRKIFEIFSSIVIQQPYLRVSWTNSIVEINRNQQKNVKTKQSK